MPRLTTVQKIQVAFSSLRHRNEIKQLLIRRHWQREKMATIEVAGTQLYFDTSDFLSNIFFWQNEYGGMYEPAVSEILATLIKSSKVYADIGGNIGYFSILPAVVNPACKVFYFEMDSTIRPILERNMALNQIGEDRITVVNAAVGDTEREFGFRPHPHSILAMINNENFDIFDYNFVTKELTIDGYFKSQGITPDLLKIDVDGFEMAALRGMSNILAEKKPDMLLEVHPSILPKMGSSAKEVHGFLLSSDYLFFQIPDFRKGRTMQFTQIFSFDGLSSESGDMLFVTQKDRHKIDHGTLQLEI